MCTYVLTWKMHNLTWAQARSVRLAHPSLSTPLLLPSPPKKASRETSVTHVHFKPIASCAASLEF